MTEAQQVYDPPPVTGYRKLTQSDVDLMNEIKAKGDELGAFIEARLRVPREPDQRAIDQRWVSIGVTDLQKGIMSLVRAVAQPSNF